MQAAAARGIHPRRVVCVHALRVSLVAVIVVDTLADVASSVIDARIRLEAE